MTTCKNCGAPVLNASVPCKYCSPAKLTDKALASGSARSSDGRLVVELVIAAGIYAAGWRYENTKLWLDRHAVGIWAIALPVWLILISFSFRPRWGSILTGVFLSIAIFGVHLGIMAWFTDLRVRDDHVGISLAIAGASLLGWLTGRGIHWLIHRARASAEPS